MSSYFLLRAPDDDRYCQIHKMAGDWKNMVMPARGARMGELYTGARDFRMADAVKGIQVPDVIENAFGFLMVTEKLKSLLERHAQGAQIEYLPFRLLNHKGRKAADPCYIANVIGTVDCADKSRSAGVDTAIYEGEYVIARKLTLVPDRIPSDTNIFRTSLFPAGVWVRDDLRGALEEEVITARFVASGEEI